MELTKAVKYRWGSPYHSVCNIWNRCWLSVGGICLFIILRSSSSQTCLVWSGSRLSSGGQVSLNQVQRRPVVQTEGNQDHGGAAAEGHLLLDCRVNKTIPTTPPDTQPTVVVVECKARFVAEEDLSPLLTISPHVTPAACAASHYVCGRHGRTAGRLERGSQHAGGS